MAENPRKRKINPDTALKDYWNRSEEFADLFNALLYNGRPVIKADELREKDTESAFILHIGSEAKGIRSKRDIFKVVMEGDNAEYALLGIENQQGVHYAMPLRDLEYSAYSYHKQYDSIKEKYPDKKGLKGNEFISHMKKSDKLIPVINAVIYYGDVPWDGAKSLYEMMDIREELKPFLNNHKLNLIEAGSTELIFNNKNNRDFFNMLHLLYDRNNKNKRADAIEYADKNNIDPAVIQAIDSTSGIKVRVKENQKGEIAVCEFFDELKEEGRNEGREEGLKTGREEGLKTGREEGLKTGKEEGRVISLYFDSEWPMEKIAERVGLSMSKVQSIISNEKEL